MSARLLHNSREFVPLSVLRDKELQLSLDIAALAIGQGIRRIKVQRVFRLAAQNHHLLEIENEVRTLVERRKDPQRCLKFKRPRTGASITFRSSQRTFAKMQYFLRKNIADAGNCAGSSAVHEAMEHGSSAPLAARAARALPLIRGRCHTYNELRAHANALLAAETNRSLFGDEPTPPTPEESSEARAFESTIEKVAAMLRAGIQDNQVVAAKRIDGSRADYLAAMQKDIRRIELSLREASVQAKFAATLV